MAASAVFVMLYIGAVEGTDRWLAPKHVMRMTVEQALLSDDAVREAYGFGAMKPGFRVAGQRWYEENSREPLRDETLRQGFITNNAVVERAGLPTTSGLPRYALKTDFAALFDPALAGDDLAASITAWQEAHLSASAMARVALVRRGAVTTGDDVIVTFPNRETRRMAPGPSSVISKGVIEEFAARFLTQPAVLWVSESGAKVVARDDELAKSLNLKITADRNLPDIYPCRPRRWWRTGLPSGVHRSCRDRWANHDATARSLHADCSRCRFQAGHGSLRDGLSRPLQRGFQKDNSRARLALLRLVCFRARAHHRLAQRSDLAASVEHVDARRLTTYLFLPTLVHHASSDVLNPIDRCAIKITVGIDSEWQAVG